MGKSKLQIPKVCRTCGDVFLAKTVKTVYCCHQCACNASNERKKKERRQKVLDKIKSDGKRYITISESLRIFTTSRNTVHRLVRSKKIRCIKVSRKRMFVCIQDLESLFPIRPEPLVPFKKESLVYDMDPDKCYTIGEISRRFNVTESSVYKHIRHYSIPIRQVGNYVYAPKKEIDKLYNNKKEYYETQSH